MALAESPSGTRTPRELVAVPERDADRVVVRLRGELDVSTVSALSEAIAEAIAVDDTDVVLDLSDVAFMDASTVGVIVGARDFLRVHSRSLALRDPSPCAARMLDLCGLSRLLDPAAADDPFEPDVAGSLASWVAVPPAGRAAQIEPDVAATGAASERA